jgi:type IV pilus assembly protein PilV
MTSRRSRGFSMIEVLVSIVILSIGLIGLVGLQARGLQFSVSAEDTNRASLLANELATSMWTARTVSLPAATISTWQTRVADVTADGLPNGSGAVSVDANGVATITITWHPPSAASGADDNRFVTQVVVP